MVTHILKSTFSRGELTPKVSSRVDLELYSGGAETLSNFVSTIHGGVRRRSGTRYAGRTKYPSGGVRFLPFVFNSSGQSYAIEFGAAYARFWTHGGQVVSGSTPVEVAMPYGEEDVGQLQSAQTGDTMLIANRDFFPRRLVRSSHTSWALSEVPFVDGPYLDVNDTTTTVTGGAAYNEGTTTTLTFSSVTGINSGAGFTADDLGRHIRVRPSGGKWIYGTISAVGGTTSISVEWKRVGAGVSDSDDTANAGGDHTIGVVSWRLGAFSNQTGYPRCVAFFEGRAVWAGTTYQPRTVFFSRSGLPYDFSPSDGDGTVADDHGFSLTILAGLVDEILWLVDAPRLQVGTSSGIRTIGASSLDQGMSPTNVSQRLELMAGASDVIPVRADNVTIYAGRFGKTLRNMYFSYEQNSLVAPTFSELSDHLFFDGVAELAYQQVPESIVWARTSTGELRGITYNREEKVIAFHQHPLQGEVQTLAVIPGVDRDELWLVVKRRINGIDTCYVEYLEAFFEDQDADDAFFVDCGLTYEGGPTNILSGLDHLEGEEVQILADGAVLPEQTVVGGQIELPNGRTASKAHVGLAQTAEIRLLKPPHQQGDGVILHRPQRVSRVAVDVLRTGGLYVGTSEDKVEPIRFRPASDLMGQAPSLADGDFTIPIDMGWDENGQVYFIATDPLPVFLRTVLLHLDSEGR